MRILLGLSLSYLLLPSILFIYYWIRPEIGFTCLALLLGAIGFIWKKLEIDCQQLLQRTIPLHIWISSLLIGILLWVTSENGWTLYKSFDHLTHHYKFNILATEALPLFNTDREVHLCYYWGYYLIPATFGRYFGLATLPYFSALGIITGLTLTLVWLLIKLESVRIVLSPISIALVTILLLIGNYVNHILPLIGALSDNGIFSNNGIYLPKGYLLNQIPILTRGLSEAVQHTLPALVAGSIFLYLVPQKHTYHFTLLILFATLFWSPFATIGLTICWSMAFLFTYRNNWKAYLPTLGTGFTLLIAFAPIILYLLSNNGTTMASNKPIWESGSSYWWLYYCIYLVTFLGSWWLLLGKWLLKTDTSLVVSAAVAFSLLGLYQMGHYNDLNMRATTPVQFLLTCYYIIALLRFFSQFSHRRRILLAVFISINAGSMLKFYYERLFLFSPPLLHNTIIQPQLPNYETNFLDFLATAYMHNSEEVIRQYTLQSESTFSKYFLREN